MRTFRLILVVMFLGTGCSQVPLPTTYPLKYQQKMQAAEHWNILAKDVAIQIAQFLESQNPDLNNRSAIYIRHKEGVFGEAFEKLLIANLLKLDLKVSQKQEGSLLLNFETQVIRHKSDRELPRFPFGTWTVLAAGIRVWRDITEDYIIPGGILLDILSGSKTELTSHEVLITTSLTKDSQYLFSKADLYYINDIDAWHYPTIDTTQTKEIRVQDR